MADKNMATILIVDDEPEIREILQTILSRKYQTVDTAENGIVALKMVAIKDYDLIVVDLNMPKMPGQALVSAIREQGDHRTAIIILTGHGTFKEAHDLLEDAAISDFLNKPTDRAELLFSIERALREQQLTHELERLVNQRTEELHQSQAMLIQTEKMASLGRLVAGVAHEVNTPISTALLSISHMEESEHSFSKSLNSGGITKKALGTLLESIRETAHESKNALGEANRLILSFKQLAVDQTTESRRSFNLHKLIKSIFSTLQIDNIDGIKTTITCSDEITLDSFPGPLGQVLSNLVENSLLHGFEGRMLGAISIHASKEGEHVTIQYKDDGVGMAATTVNKIFDPFFTTKINQGGNGIGMSITFNLVTGILGGTIECQSAPGEGACFSLCIPLNAIDRGHEDE
ncbi:MAG: response regulator [Candidatus Polarisedimenticolaceae bacterium]|nr:response regulator [Candidatus Polarisedimenticolaceae bacterium]